MYHEGRVVLQDYQEAVMWFQLAAKQGTPSHEGPPPT